jgi:hypothetical protein
VLSDHRYVERLALSFETEVPVELQRGNPRRAPRDRSTVLGDVGQTTFQERHPVAVTADLRKRRHPSDPPGVEVLFAGKRFSHHGGDPDQFVFLERAEVERIRGLVAGIDELVQLMVRAEDPLPKLPRLLRLDRTYRLKHL